MTAFTIKTIYASRAVLRRPMHGQQQHSLFANPYQKPQPRGNIHAQRQVGKRHNSSNANPSSTNPNSASSPNAAPSPTPSSQPPPPPAANAPPPPTNAAKANPTIPSNSPSAPLPTPKSTPTTSTPPTTTKISIWSRLGPLTHGMNFYARSQSKRPYVTQFVSALFIYSAGDFGAQQITNEPYDPWRTLRALVIASGSAIPAYRWFLYLGTIWNIKGRPLVSLAAKVVTNQLVFTPVFNSYFFAMQHILVTLQHHFIPSSIRGEHHHSWSQSLSLSHLAYTTADHIYRTVPTSFVNSWKLWPAVTAFSFTFVQPQYRSFFAGWIFLGWQVYLSWLNRKEEKVEERIEEWREERREEVVEERRALGVTTQ